MPASKLLITMAVNEIPAMLSEGSERKKIGNTKFWIAKTVEDDEIIWDTIEWEGSTYLIVTEDS